VRFSVLSPINAAYLRPQYRRRCMSSVRVVPGHPRARNRRVLHIARNASKRETTSRARHILPSTSFSRCGAQSAGRFLVSAPFLLLLSPLTSAQYP
jgi:hypothetical protein